MNAKIPTTTRAWLAALIDGEGCIVLNHRHKNALRPRYRIQIRVYNTDIRLIRKVVERTGTGRVAVMSMNRPNHQKLAYYWGLSPSEQEIWLKRLLPWLVCKREQALLVLEVIKLRKTLCPHKSQKWLHPGESASLTKRITEIHGEMRKLNRKGKAST